MAKIYNFRGTVNDCVDLWWSFDTAYKPIPVSVAPVIQAPFGSVSTMQMIALALLLDWFGDENDAECKAVALSASLGVKLAKLGARRQVPFSDGKRGFDLTEEELGKMVAEIMVTAGEMVAACTPTEQQVKMIEYIAGQRRDTVRHEALAETTPLRLMN
jgi:hypothetical protein